MGTSTSAKVKEEIVLYSDSFRQSWNEFIELKAINSTFLHSRDFFDHNPLNAEQESSLIFKKGDEIIAVLPAVLYIKDGKRILHSHLRATYGGFVVSSKVGVEEAINIVGQTISFSKKQEVDQIIIRNPFRIFQTNLCDETDYALWYHGFNLKSRELEIAIELNHDMNQIRSRYRKGIEYKIRKAREVIDIRIAEDFKQFWVLLEKGLMERHRQVPVHDYNALCNLRENVGKDKVLLFAAYYEKRLIGGIVVFIFENLAVHAQYSATDERFKHLHVGHALIDYIVDWANTSGAKFFNLGMGNEEDGKKVNYGLFFFKECFGGRGVLRETMSLNIENN